MIRVETITRSSLLEDEQVIHVFEKRLNELNGRAICEIRSATLVPDPFTAGNWVGIIVWEGPRDDPPEPVK
jgi:hypothetical protein